MHFEVMTASILENGLQGDNTGEKETSGETIAEVYIRQYDSLHLTSDDFLNSLCFCIWHIRH